MYNYFIGIDGGKKGGISIIDNNQRILLKEPIPLISSSKGQTYDINKINNILKKYSKNSIAMLEKAHPVFGNGIKQSFTIGELFGIMKTLLIINKIPFEIVLARVWQKNIFQGNTTKNTKNAAFEFVKLKYPNEDFVVGNSKKFHDGIVDSLCIAIYNYRCNK